MKTKVMLAAAAGALATAWAGSASADITFCVGGGCTGVPQGETVHLGGDNGTAGSPGGVNTIFGDLKSGLVDVIITGAEGIHTDPLTGGGQVGIVANDFVAGSGNDLDVGGLKTLTFALEDGWWFTALEFNLTPGKTAKPLPAWSLTLNGYDQDGDLWTKTFLDQGNGGFYNGYAINGQHITSVSFTTTTEIARVAQIRVGGAELIPTQQGTAPEPASWALMIVGFGGVGATMRRRRRAPA